MFSENEPLLKDYYAKKDKKKGVQRVLLLTMSVLIVLLVITVIFISVLYALNIRRNVDECSLPVSNLTSQNLYLHSAIASDGIPCSSIANNIMSVKGGNAIDGVIAGIVCACTVNLHSCGLAGGSLMLFYNKKERKAYAIDLREIAPESASENMYENDPTASLIGGKAIAVMGLMSGYYEVHQKFGKLSWKTLLEPTIDLLNTGFYVSNSLENAIKTFFSKPQSVNFKELRNLLTDQATGKPKKYGDIIKIPKLADTMKILLTDPYAMKNGSLADTVIEEIQSNGGIITKNDLNNYQIKWRTPIQVNLGDGKQLYALPPPSSGVIVAFGMNVLSGYDFDSNFLNTCENTGLFFHRLIETMKFSFAKRSALGDIDFVPNTKLLNNLTSHSYAQWIKSLITDDRTHPIEYYQPSFDIKSDQGTSHFSLVSPDGDAVSITSTINTYFGSLVMGNQTGIIYNNEMDDFSSPNITNTYGLPPSPSNFIKPYKRPMSSMSPIIIIDKSGNVKLVMGASGGSKILSSVMMVSVFAELLKKGIKESIDVPRVHHQLLPNEVMVENIFPEAIIKMLKKRGHRVTTTTDIAIAQGIKISPNSQMWECNADFRKMGLCDGS